MSKKKYDTQMNLMPTYDSIHFDGKINLAIDSFINEGKCNNCINEMFIDKILPNYTLITLRSKAFSPDYLKNNNPIFFAYINKTQFYIYSGIEDVFQGNKKYLNPSKNSSSNEFICWSLILKGDSMKIEKEFSYPFFPSESLRPY